MATHTCWMGWIGYECGYEYLDPNGLSRSGDSGRAYGMYQFDYRWGLVPFMQSCVAYNSTRYAGFNQYIAMGAGNTALVNNSNLLALFQGYASAYTAEFQYLQDVQAVTNYLEPIINLVQQNYGYDLATKGPYVLGSAFSMAIRSGANPAYTFFANGANMSVTNLINQSYTMQGNLYYDNGRWDITVPNPYYSQYQRLQNDMANMTYLYVVPYGGYIPPGPTPVGRRRKFPIWMMLNKNYRVERK